MSNRTPPKYLTTLAAFASDAKRADAGIGAITRHLIPFMVATVSVLILITYVPSLVSSLPSLFR